MNERDKELLKEAGNSFGVPFDKWCQKFADLIRADEREACERDIEELIPDADRSACAQAIRARGNT